MATGRFSDWWVDARFDELMAMDLFAALAFANPFEASNPLDVEVVGEEYERDEITKGRPSFNVIWNNNLLVFGNLPPGTHIEAYMVFDADVNGHMISAVLLDDPVDLVSGGTHSIPVNMLQLGIDVALGP